VTSPHPLSSDLKHCVARLYTSVAPDYEDKGPPFFAHAGRRLVDLSEVAPGHAVLDVATGRGAALFPAANRVGPTGAVIGIDLAEGMVAYTRAAVERRGETRVSVRQMDAEQLAFGEESFDRVLCSFAVFFFPDVPRVLAEMRRVLRPGGKVGFAFIRGVDPRWAWYGHLLRKYDAVDDLPPRPGTSGVRAAGTLVALLAEAGFANAHETVEEAELTLGDEDRWWASLWTHGARVSLERLSPDTLDRFHTECLTHTRALVGPSGLVAQDTFVYVTAALE